MRGVEERLARGKDKTARIEMSVVHADEQVLISVSDDGRGLDRDAILKKAMAKGLVPAGAQMSDAEVHNLIFAPGFSTKDAVSQISGRGVGLDVVQKAVESLKGHIQVTTLCGHGTKFLITLPLSFSIIEGMIIEVDACRYIVPISQLVETMQFAEHRIETSAGVGRMINLRGDVIPILRLGEILHGTWPRATCGSRCL